MVQPLRRSVVPAALSAFLIFTAVGSAHQAQKPANQTAAKPSTPPTPAPTPPPPPPKPEQTAYTAAMAIKEPDAKLAALETIRTDFPQASNLNAVDAQILSTLVMNFSDRTDAITSVFDRTLARIPADAPPELRLSLTISPVSLLVTKRLLLDRSEKLISDALAGLNLDGYIASQNDSAKRANRPAPSRALLETSFNSARGRGLEQLARIDMAMAEENFKAAIKANPNFSTAQPALVDLYMAKGDSVAAEAVLKDAIKASTTPAAASRPTMALVDFYTKKGDTAAAEALLKDTVKANPTLSTALLALARIENKRGDSQLALDHYLTAAAGGPLAPADNAAMRELHRKVHGSDTCLEGDLDKVYADSYPNPVKPEHFKSVTPPVKNPRMVLLEMFTGSGCGPCVSADLAFDAAMERYGNLIVPIAYHQNIPAPDPMVIASGDHRREYYDVHGVPTLNIDGTLGKLGGGARAGAPGNYNDYIAKIDKELSVPAQANLTLSATSVGDSVNVTAAVSKLPPNAKDLRLHILLVERELRFQGENGVRFHPMVVRAIAGDKGTGIPIAANGTTKYTFDLGAIKSDITSTLAADIDKRRQRETAGSTPARYAAEGKAYTAIDPTELSVVAFIQQGPYVAPAKDTGAPQGAVEGGVPASAPTPASTPTPTATSALQKTAQQLATVPAAGAKPAASGLPINVLQAAKTDVVSSVAAGKGKSGGQ